MRAPRDTFPCPACGAPLFAGRAPDTTMLACKGCAGVWLDPGASRLADKAELSATALAIVAIVDASEPRLTRPGAAPYRSSPVIGPESRCCPVCGEPLARRLAAEIELDVCEAHGTWFDRHELRAMVQAGAFKREVIAMLAELLVAK